MDKVSTWFTYLALRMHTLVKFLTISKVNIVGKIDPKRHHQEKK